MSAFSIIIAIMSLILGIYSIYTSRETTKKFLEVLKIYLKTQNIKSNVEDLRYEDIIKNIKGN